MTLKSCRIFHVAVGVALATTMFGVPQRAVAQTTAAQSVSTRVLTNNDRSVYRATGDQRWIHSAQRTESAPWQYLSEQLIRLDSVTRVGPRGTSEGRVFNSHRSTCCSNSWTRIWRSAQGYIDSLTATYEVRQDDASRMFADIGPSMEELAFAGADDTFNFFQAFLGTAPSAPRTTPLRLQLRQFGFVRDLEGTITSRVLRDSLVDGRRLQIIRDSARVTIKTESSVDERTLYAKRRDSRNVSGSIIIRRVYDPAAELSVQLVDTTALAGTETRRLPDGRTYSDRVRFERRRSIVLLDSAAFRQAESREFGVGMIRRPEIGEPTRLDASKPRVQDSLVSAYKVGGFATRDSITRVSNLLYERGMRERLSRIHLAEHDTSAAVALIDLGHESPLTPWSYQLVRPLMDNPALAMRLGKEANDLYEAFTYQFEHYPPLLVRDTTRRWCVPSVCAMVGEEWTRAKEPRLRYVGLMALYSMDPAKWADTLIKLHKSGVQQLAAVSIHAQALGRRSIREPGVPLPLPGADWHAWYAWVRGTSDSAAAQTPAVANFMQARANADGDPLEFRAMDGASSILRMAQFRFGVSYRDTFELKLATATVDSARYLYNGLLRTLGAPPPGADVVFANLRLPSQLESAFARSEIPRLRFATADSATVAAIERVLVDHLLDSVPLWRPFNRDSLTRTDGFPISKRDSTYIVSGSLSRTSIARLEAAGVAVKPTTWRLPNEASGRTIQIGPVRRIGAFASIAVTNTNLVRLADGRGGGDAAGGTFYLVLIDGEWRMVDALFWVT